MKSRFLTLTFDLEYRDIVQIHPFTKFVVCMSNGSAVRVFTDRRTDGTENITSTADKGSKKPDNIQIVCAFQYMNSVLFLLVFNIRILFHVQTWAQARGQLNVLEDEDEDF